MNKKAVILTSGGIDSTTCLAIAISKGYECYTLAFDYGQKHRAELRAAASISQKLGAKEHRVFQLPLAHFGGSALTDDKINVPDFQEGDEIPVTYVPARNTIFLSIALGFAEIIKAYEIFIGVSAIDYSHYPDCRPDYIEQFQKLTNLATKEGRNGIHFHIHTPLIHLTKAQTINLGLQLGVDYGQTVSCYRADQDGLACGTCDSCTFRRKGFMETSIQDMTRYKS